VVQVNETNDLLIELAGIFEDWCRNQIKTHKKLAKSKELPPGLKEDIQDRVRYLELSHHKIQKFIEKVKTKHD